MSRYYEIVDKTTGDRVNWPVGIFALVGFATLLGLLVGRGCQEIKKHAEKPKAPTTTVVTNAVINVR